MEAQANTTREQSNKNNIGWRPSHGENGGVGKKKICLVTMSGWAEKYLLVKYYLVGSS